MISMPGARSSERDTAGKQAFLRRSVATGPPPSDRAEPIRAPQVWAQRADDAIVSGAWW